MNFSRLNRILDWSVGVGKLFGVPIRLHITILFFLWPALSRSGLNFWYAVEFAVGIVLSILLHELGHALTAKYFKQSGLSIMLHGFGGFAESQGHRTPKQDLIIVLAGPAVTFALGFALRTIGTAGLSGAHVGGEESYQYFVVASLGSLNILMGFLNLIPCLPFDGGRALCAILTFRIPEFKAFRHVAHLGLVIAPPIFIWGLVKDQGFLVIFGLIGFITSLMHLLNSGGVRFGEALSDRRARKEEEAFKKRQRAKNDAYLDEVNARAREREEQERLRRLLK